jgi:hypothetical protein
MSEYATMDDFNRAPLGHPFLEACSVCGTETGSIVMKRKGRGSKEGSSIIPRKMVTPEARCEFCTFLGAWFASEDIDPAETGLKYGAAKLVEVLSSGEEKLVAFVPFSSEEDASSQLSDGTTFQFKHGAVIRCTREDSVVSLVEVTKVGV